MKGGVKWIALLSLAAAGLSEPAWADPWKDESGKGRERGGYASRYDDATRERFNDGYGRSNGRSRYAEERVRIPRGHLPPPGECRTWYPGRPAGHQPAPHRC